MEEEAAQGYQPKTVQATDRGEYNESQLIMNAAP